MEVRCDLGSWLTCGTHSGTRFQGNLGSSHNVLYQSIHLGEFPLNVYIYRTSLLTLTNPMGVEVNDQVEFLMVLKGLFLGFYDGNSCLVETLIFFGKQTHQGSS